MHDLIVKLYGICFLAVVHQFAFILLTLKAPWVTVVIWYTICFYFSCSVRASYIKVRGATMLPWVNYTRETSRLFLYHRIQKLRKFMAIFVLQPIHFEWEEFVLIPTAPYIVQVTAIPWYGSTQKQCRTCLSNHLLMLELLIIKGAWHSVRLLVFAHVIVR